MVADYWNDTRVCPHCGHQIDLGPHDDPVKCPRCKKNMKEPLGPPPKKTRTVWMTFDYLGADVPTVTRYEAVRVAKESITVVSGRGRPQVIRLSSGRRFFTSKDAMLSYCRYFMIRQVEMKRSQIATLEKQIMRPDLGIEVIPHGSAVRVPPTDS